MLSVYHFIILSLLVFCIGLFGMLRRKNILMLFLSTEIMLNGLNIAFVAIGRYAFSVDGEMMALFVIAIAASEVAIGLGFILAWWRKHKTLDIDYLTKMKG